MAISWHSSGGATMIFFREHDDYEPLMWVRGYPVDVTAFLIAIYSLATVLGLALIGFGHGGWLAPLMFDTGAILGKGSVWQVLTYPLVNIPLGQPGFWPILMFVIKMVVLAFFGREVERYIGRRRYVGLHLALVVVPPLVLLAFSPFFGSALSGLMLINTGLVIVFAMLYPNVELFWRISAKWIAILWVGIIGLVALSGQNGAMLAALAVTSLTAVFYMRWLREETPFGGGGWPWRQQPEGMDGYPPRVHTVSPVAEEDPVAAIDPLLDKITEHGIESLTPEERARLEHARRMLLRRSEQRGNSLSARR